MNKAEYIGTVSLEYIDRLNTNWQARIVTDFTDRGLITPSPDHLFTVGSGIHSSMVSMATTPAYPLPTHSQFYTFGADAVRWGGPKDPFEVDFDRYGFTPDFNRGVAIMWKAPKSEPHHLSEVPQMINSFPSDWQEFCRAILNKQLP